MSFRLVPKSVTLNDLERRNGIYFVLFQRIRVASLSGSHAFFTHQLILDGKEFCCLYVGSVMAPPDQC